MNRAQRKFKASLLIYKILDPRKLDVNRMPKEIGVLEAPKKPKANTMQEEPKINRDTGTAQADLLKDDRKKENKSSKTKVEDEYSDTDSSADSNSERYEKDAISLEN